ncbi:tetratricopeptide repeat protein [Lysinibacillus sp. FSL H8-0500]|uniref:tetratricopeptide repeat protein n=1 Tax=Lysinibacillus sp. FSL H8-0500 TaxID=2921393 RepID=UPI0031011B0A
MKSLKEQLTEAVLLIQEGQYLYAKDKLQALYEPKKKNDLLTWSLSLCYIAIGEPYQALFLWRSLKRPNLFPLAEQRTAVIQSLPVYEEIAKTYNKALICFQQNQFEKGLEYLLPLLKIGYVLPTVVYKAILFSGALLHNEQYTKQLLQNMPVHIQQLPDTKQILLFMHQSNLEQPVEVAKNKLRSGKIMFSLVSILAAITIIVLPLLFKKEAPPLSVPATLENQETLIDKQRDTEISQLKATIDKLEAQLSETSKLEQQIDEENPFALFSAEEIAQIAATLEKSSYQQGLQAFQKGDYPTATALFEKSLAINKDAYYSDDAMYFLLQAQIAQGRPNEAINTGQQFLHMDNKTFWDSPYRDDTMLSLSGLLQEQHLNEAKILLQKLVELYPEDWTGIEAKRRLVDESYDEN